MLDKNAPANFAYSSYSKEDIQAHIEKIIKDSTFFSSDILKRFLLFIVKETLEGRANCLKEYTIAMSVLDKPASFRPQESGIVRIHAGRLRRALTKYYCKMGATDGMRISIPKGNYVPVFEKFENANLTAQSFSSHEIVEDNTALMTVHKDKIKVAVLPFRYSAKQKVACLLADGIAFQLTSGLQHVKNISVTAFQMIKNLSERTIDLRELTDIIGSQFVLTGGVDTFEDRIRVSMELVKASTFEQIWSDVFDKRISQSNLFDLQDEIIKSALHELQASLNYQHGNLTKVALMPIGRVRESNYSG
jgi:TolB-like protein